MKNSKSRVKAKCVKCGKKFSYLPRRGVAEQRVLCYGKNCDPRRSFITRAVKKEEVAVAEEEVEVEQDA